MAEIIKCYKSYPKLRKMLKTKHYNSLDDSIGQYNDDNHSVDITLRDYDGNWCIITCDTSKGKAICHKVCDVSKMPLTETMFWKICEEHIKLEIREMENNNWIPVSSGLFPEDEKNVQVTFIGYNDHAPHCEGFAFRYEGNWYWTLDENKVKVEITAWKNPGEPYNENN